jgi:membrane protease YdiL (CAAX protease family)
MNNKLLFKILIFSVILFFPCLLISGQAILDHKIFLEEIEHSSENIYKDCIRKYDQYLNKFPGNISVRIEKCKFIQEAQYNESEDYNPNQEEFDSCSSILVRMYPENPAVIIYQTTYLWGDDLNELFKKAEKAINGHPEEWNKSDLGMLYFKMADQYYGDSDYQSAFKYIQKAILNDEKYRSSLEFARILTELDKKKEALDVLMTFQDTTKETWQLHQKADLLFKLKSYKEALKVYNKIDEIDSSFNNNYELAKTLEAVGEFEYARKYLIADTSKNWDKKTALRNLLNHDLKHQNGTICIGTYNKYRDFGYSMDPLAIYRLKLFFFHPLNAWKLRDIIGLMTLVLVFIILISAPSIWILPVYFIGHNWNLLTRKKLFESQWGLKMFWFVSAGYLVATFFSVIAVPEYLYSLLNSSNSDYVLTPEKEGLMSLIFILFFAFFGLASLYKVNPGILLSKKWSVMKSILLGTGILIAYKILIAVYIRMGITIFGISKDDLASFPDVFLASKQNIQAILDTYGTGAGYLLCCLLVPLYEEIIFRGVILGSIQRYINFNTANILQAILFSAIHLNLFLFPVFFLFGITVGILRKESGGLLSGIVFHVVNNLLAITIIIFR